MKRPVYLIIVIFITIVGLAIAQVSVANQISTTGAELAALQTEVDEYKRQNTVLQEELLAAASFTTIAEQAEELGYEQVKNRLTLSESLPLALKQ
jgi:cell division protein FtsL